MVCGSKRYVVDAIINEEEQNVRVPARTPAEARKKFRAKYGETAKIIVVKEMYG